MLRVDAVHFKMLIVVCGALRVLRCSLCVVGRHCIRFCLFVAVLVCSVLFVVCCVLFAVRCCLLFATVRCYCRSLFAAW